MSGALTIGIIGGMGPAAGADLFQKIIQATPATRDQEHLRVLVDSNPQIPDRIAFLQGEGPDPGPVIAATALNLERAGAGLLVIACNTAHLFHDQVAQAVSIPVLHMMQEMRAAMEREHPGIRRVGLLATASTIKLGLYHKELEQAGICVLTPEAAEQAAVAESLFWVKAGQLEEPRQIVRGAARRLISRGAEAIIAGCTEIPLVLSQTHLPVPYLDATEVLARAAVRRARAAP